MPKNLLIISPYVPYDKVPHAGGKTHNYYLKKFHNDENFTVKLITFAKTDEKEKIDLSSYHIDSDITFYENNLFKKIERFIWNMNSKFNPFDKNAGMCSGYVKKVIINKLKRLKTHGYYPELIVLEWTNIVLMINEIKKVFPNAKFIASEHDVSFLAFERRYILASSRLDKFKKRIKYNNIYKSELKSLKQFDLIMPHNFKDKDLLIKNQTSSTKVDFITPYFINMSNIQPTFSKKNILFFGAMDRSENYESCIWFIKNVFNELIKIDKSYRFYILGGNPHSSLRKYENEYIKVTGFVDDITPYFQNSLCMVVPLLTGAGIKVKVLESMSSGIAVLTNEIGIEGIPAEDKKEYLYCKTPTDYLRIIIEITNNRESLMDISQNAKFLIEDQFNLEKSYENYKYKVMNLFL